MLTVRELISMYIKSPPLAKELGLFLYLLKSKYKNSVLEVTTVFDWLQDHGEDKAYLFAKK